MWRVWTQDTNFRKHRSPLTVSPRLCSVCQITGRHDLKIKKLNTLLAPKIGPFQIYPPSPCWVFLDQTSSAELYLCLFSSVLQPNKPPMLPQGCDQWTSNDAAAKVCERLIATTVIKPARDKNIICFVVDVMLQKTSASVLLTLPAKRAWARDYAQVYFHFLNKVWRPLFWVLQEQKQKKEP